MNISTEDKNNNNHYSHIYSVIPVFNRIKDTLKCIERLKNQNSINNTIIVVDGGSSDGTSGIVRGKHPDVVLLDSNKTLWWGDAMHLGIEWVLSSNSKQSDFIFMVNNDSLFGPDTIRFLTESSLHHNAVVGGVIINSDDHQTVLDGGTTIDWFNYSFDTVNEIPENNHIKLDCDVLGGRGTLIPIWAIIKAGNIDKKAFPHYISDYEFTYRLKTRGNLPLAVDYRARIETKIDSKNINDSIKNIFCAFRNTISKRSKSNIFCHLRFIFRHSPKKYRLNLILKIFIGKFSLLCPRCTSYYKKLLKLVFGSYLISEEDCNQFSLSSSTLCQRKILAPSMYHGYYIFIEPYSWLKKNEKETLPLFWFSWNPINKIKKYYATHPRNN